MIWGSYPTSRMQGFCTRTVTRNYYHDLGKYAP